MNRTDIKLAMKDAKAGNPNTAETLLHQLLNALESERAEKEELALRAEQNPTILFQPATQKVEELEQRNKDLKGALLAAQNKLEAWQDKTKARKRKFRHKVKSWNSCMRIAVKLLRLHQGYHPSLKSITSRQIAETANLCWELAARHHSLAMKEMCGEDPEECYLKTVKAIIKIEGISKPPSYPPRRRYI